MAIVSRDGELHSFEIEFYRSIDETPYKYGPGNCAGVYERESHGELIGIHRGPTVAEIQTHKSTKGPWNLGDLYPFKNQPLQDLKMKDITHATVSYKVKLRRNIRYIGK